MSRRRDYESAPSGLPGPHDTASQEPPSILHHVAPGHHQFYRLGNEIQQAPSMGYPNLGSAINPANYGSIPVADRRQTNKDGPTSAGSKSDEDEFDASSPQAPMRKSSSSNRSAMACVLCRKQKMKCEGRDKAPCKRCRAAKVECTFEPSQPSSTNVSRGKTVSKDWVETRMAAVEGRLVQLESRRNSASDTASIDGQAPGTPASSTDALEARIAQLEAQVYALTMAARGGLPQSEGTGPRPSTLEVAAAAAAAAAAQQHAQAHAAYSNSAQEHHYPYTAAAPGTIDQHSYAHHASPSVQHAQASYSGYYPAQSIDMHAAAGLPSDQVYYADTRQTAGGPAPDDPAASAMFVNGGAPAHLVYDARLARSSPGTGR